MMHSRFLLHAIPLYIVAISRLSYFLCLSARSMLHKNSTTGREYHQEIQIMINSKLDFPYNYPFCFILIVECHLWAWYCYKAMWDGQGHTKFTQGHSSSRALMIVGLSVWTLYFDPTENVFSILIQYFPQLCRCVGHSPSQSQYVHELTLQKVSTQEYAILTDTQYFQSKKIIYTYHSMFIICDVTFIIGYCCSVSFSFRVYCSTVWIPLLTNFIFPNHTKLSRYGYMGYEGLLLSWFRFHSSTHVHRVNEIGRHHLGYVPLFSPQNRRFDRQLDHNIQQEHIYSRVWFHDEWRRLRSSGYVEWSLECNVNLTTVWNKSIFITT